MSKIVRVAFDIEVEDNDKVAEVLKYLNADREKGGKDFLKSTLHDEVEAKVTVRGREAHEHQFGGECPPCYETYFKGRKTLPDWDD